MSYTWVQNFMKLINYEKNGIILTHILILVKSTMVQKISANEGGWGNDIGRGEYKIALNLNNGPHNWCYGAVSNGFNLLPLLVKKLHLKK